MRRTLSSLPASCFAAIRHTLQDWDIWLSKQDNKGNDVNLRLENIYLDQLQEEGRLLYERLQVRLIRVIEILAWTSEVRGLTLTTLTLRPPNYFMVLVMHKP